MRREEDLQTHGLRFIQDTDLFLFGTDGVELANFAAPPAGARVCDLGAGTGIISVLLAGKYGGGNSVGLLRTFERKLAHKRVKHSNSERAHAGVYRAFRRGCVQSAVQ